MITLLHRANDNSGLVSGGHRGQRSRWQIEPNPALLPRRLHEELQEDHRRRLPRKAPQVTRLVRVGVQLSGF